VIADLKPYPAMKDSGVPWLGDVPERWRTERGKWLFRKMDRPIRDSDEVVTCFRDGTVTLRKNRRVRGFTEALREIGYQGIRSGDLVIHAMDAFAGAIGVADSDGKATPVYSVCEPESDANAHYYAYTVREMARSQWVQALAKGIRERSTDFRFGDFGSQLLPLPPLPEQAAIVRFLDHADRRIRRSIDAKQKLIKLLEEQKQAIIHRAVTRGLDRNVRLKPSGVEWLGDVPEHWEVRRLKQAFRRVVGGSTPPSGELAFWDGDVVWVTPADVSKSSRLKDSLRRITHDGLRACSSEVVPQGSLIVTSRAPVGNVAIAETNLCTNQGCKALVATPAVVDPLFGFHVLTTLKGELQSLATGTTFTEISTSRLGAVSLPLPPLPEQAAIVRFLDVATASISAAVDKAQREISLLREYRARLIADVVTGKVDVRDAAARLPDEADEPEPLDEADANTAVEEATADDLDAELVEAEA
jgi:type I restriction enzyme S subunit